MSSSTPVQLVVAAFPDENKAAAVYQELKQARKDGTIVIQNAAVLRKDTDGKLHVKDVYDMGGGKGAVIGGVLGGVVGLLAGPVGWAALAGAVAGGAIAKHADGGFSDARLKKLGEGLTPGSSAIVAVVEHVWVDEVEAAMAQAGADYVTEALSADIAAQLAAGGQVAFTAVAADDGVVTSRVATQGDQVQVSAVAATAEGIVAVAAEGTIEPAAPAAPAPEAPAADEPAAEA
jgi:uncharacterized membrane protein